MAAAPPLSRGINAVKKRHRKPVSGGGFEFVAMDAATLARRPAFDAEKLVAALAESSKERIDPRKLPFQPRSGTGLCRTYGLS